MARSVVWVQLAAADLETAAEFIARDSPSYASVFVEETIDASRSLRRLAERGRVVPEFDVPDLRELLVQNYRMIYRVEPNRVTIVALIHGRRDLISAWKERS
ncbi:MAG: type II toxin-antitoxin system RelE/ParE family toxin [Thermoanaerobaculia bacterium]